VRSCLAVQKHAHAQAQVFAKHPQHAGAHGVRTPDPQRDSGQQIERVGHA